MAANEFRIINSEQLEEIKKGFLAVDQIFEQKTNLLIASYQPEVQLIDGEVQLTEGLDIVTLLKLKRFKGFRKTLEEILAEFSNDLEKNSIKTVSVSDLPTMLPDLFGGHGI